MYNMPAVKAMIKKLSDFCITTNTKAAHYSKVEELRAILREHGWSINRWLLGDDTHDMQEYSKAVNIFYKLKTKKELDKQLHRAKQEYLYQLKMIQAEYYSGLDK